MIVHRLNHGIAFLSMLCQSARSRSKRQAVDGSQHDLNRRQFEDVPIRFLRPKPNKTAIADVLSDMDAEIAALEQRRDKTRALKQGMMQELLTGRTRLV